MKNLIKLFGLIALAAVIGFSMTACPSPTNSNSNSNSGSSGNTPLTVDATTGQLTVTGLGTYNGKWIIAQGINEAYTLSINAADSITTPTITITGAEISGGSATLKVWKATSETHLSNYNGNDTLITWAVILTKATLNLSEYTQLRTFLERGGTPPSFVHAYGNVGTGSPLAKVTFTSGTGTGPFALPPP